MRRRTFTFHDPDGETVQITVRRLGIGTYIAINDPGDTVWEIEHNDLVVFDVLVEIDPLPGVPEWST